MGDVFISYAHKNRERVDNIADGLAESGYSLWWDPDLKAGDNYSVKIEQAIENAKGVVVCWSQQAKDSLWVRAEATEALDTGKLIQLRIDQSRMPLPFNVIQMTDLASWKGDRNATEWQDLDGEVATKIGRDIQVTPDSPAGTLPPRQRLQGLGPLVATGSAMLAIAAIVAALAALLAQDMIDIGMFRTLSIAGFGAALAGTVFIGWRTMRTAIATRRR